MAPPSAGSNAATSLLVKPAVSRLAGNRPSRLAAVLAAAAAGAGTAVFVYRLLRSAGDEDTAA
jgi:hypothetical protein